MINGPDETLKLQQNNLSKVIVLNTTSSNATEQRNGLWTPNFSPSMSLVSGQSTQRCVYFWESSST